MNIKEKKAKIQELKERIETLEREISSSEIGYKDDPIFLLSTEEYKRYAGIIPTSNCSCSWWLRSPGFMSEIVAVVWGNGMMNYIGEDINKRLSIRPALRIDHNIKVGERLVSHGYTWIAIDTNIVICEKAIAIGIFDEEMNDYETSEIRQFLLDWYKERK